MPALPRRRLDGSSSRAAIDALERSWRAAPKVPAPASGATDVGRLRQEFAGQMVRLKTTCADSRWHRPGCRSLVSAALANSRLSRFLFEVFEEIAARPESASRKDELVLVEQLISFHGSAVTKLEAQSQVLDGFERRIAMLQSLADELQRSPAPKADGWRRLVAEITTDSARASSADLLPIAGFALATAGPPEHVAINRAFGRGASCARLLGRMLVDCDVERREIERVMLAAILQDTGLLLLQRRADIAENHDHASLGAALTGGLTGISAEVPTLVGGHHRRLNLSHGGPLSSETLAARLLSAAVRLIELIELAEFDEEWDTAGQRQCANLVQEAAAGWWDPDAVRVLIRTVGYAPDQAELQMLEERSTMRRLLATRYRLDDPRRSIVPRPHIEFPEAVFANSAQFAAS